MSEIKYPQSNDLRKLVRFSAEDGTIWLAESRMLLLHAAALAGLRNPGKAVEQDGGNTLPVLMVEACSTRYSGPILKNDAVRFLSILMPCKISVYKKNDGKVYIGLMNAELIGSLFGAEVHALMKQVAADQAKFVTFDPSKPAPPMITTTPGSGGSGSSAGSAGGC